MIDDDRRLKSKAFFDRGTLVAKIEKYELAIDMYIQGFALDPDDADQHQALRDISLKRKAGGANPIETFTALKLKRSSGDPKQDMLNAERLLASPTQATQITCSRCTTPRRQRDSKRRRGGSNRSCARRTTTVLSRDGDPPRVRNPL